jgi:hypothetical protein
MKTLATIATIALALCFISSPTQLFAADSRFVFNFNPGTEAQINAKGASFPCVSTEEKATMISESTDLRGDGTSLSAPGEDLEKATNGALYLVKGTIVLGLRSGTDFIRGPFLIRILGGKHQGAKCWFPDISGFSRQT